MVVKPTITIMTASTITSNMVRITTKAINTVMNNMVIMLGNMIKIIITIRMPQLKGKEDMKMLRIIKAILLRQIPLIKSMSSGRHHKQMMPVPRR